MKSKAGIPAKTIKKICHPWKLRLSIGQSRQWNGGDKQDPRYEWHDACRKILRHGAHKMAQHVAFQTSIYQPACFNTGELSRARGKKTKKQLLYCQVPM